MRVSRRVVLAGIAATSLIGLHKSYAAGGFLELTARATRVKLAGNDSPDSDLIGYDGLVPGPVLRFTQGQAIRIRYRNELDQPTTVHWHGIRLVNAMDGVPGLTQEPVQPGASFDYEFTAPDAGTFWYHAHVNSWDQVARGLFGALIIDEAEPAFAPENDQVLVLTDWRLDENGLFDVASLGSPMDWSHAGRIGGLVTVNGAVLPEYALSAGSMQRLRLINSSTARVLKLTLAGAMIVARDGQTLAQVIAMPEKFVLGPAQRVDLTIVPVAGAVSELVETSSKPFALASFMGVASSTFAPMPMLRPASLLEPDLDAAIPVRLSMQGGSFGKLNGVAVAEMHVGMEMPGEKAPLWAFNEVSGMGETPLFDAHRGQTIRLDMINDTQWDHAIHIHGHHFRIISRQGISTGDLAWLDTVMIGPGEVLQTAFVADNPGEWMIHCHMLEHSASGMDTWFRVG